jgi:hypothetical protein
VRAAHPPGTLFVFVFLSIFVFVFIVIAIVVVIVIVIVIVIDSVRAERMWARAVPSRNALVPSSRPFPIALPAEAPFDNVGTRRLLARPDQRSVGAPSPLRDPRGSPP